VTDDELVLAITSGDRDAFARLVERESLMVYRVCYRVLGSVSDAEDAAQDTFVQAFRALGGCRGEGSLAGWLRRIAARQHPMAVEAVETRAAGAAQDPPRTTDRDGPMEPTGPGPSAGRRLKPGGACPALLFEPSHPGPRSATGLSSTVGPSHQPTDALEDAQL
jgi:hypothetical protein